MLVEGSTVPVEVLDAEKKAEDFAVPHVNFYDPSAFKVNAAQDVPQTRNRRQKRVITGVFFRGGDGDEIGQYTIR